VGLRGNQLQDWSGIEPTNEALRSFAIDPVGVLFQTGTVDDRDDPSPISDQSPAFEFL
jgi:hypothetical protein